MIDIGNLLFYLGNNPAMFDGQFLKIPVWYNSIIRNRLVGI